MADLKQYAPACDRNRDPIGQVLNRILPQRGSLLEIGSGTGQHAAWFAPLFPDLSWQPSDLLPNLAGIDAWAAESGASNLRPAVEIDLSRSEWGVGAVDALLSINTIHIVAWTQVETLFRVGASILNPGGSLIVYGPYRYSDRPLEASNEAFDVWLKQRNSERGIRDFDKINQLAMDGALTLGEDIPMPANNRMIWWQKS